MNGRLTTSGEWCEVFGGGRHVLKRTRRMANTGGTIHIPIGSMYGIFAYMWHIFHGKCRWIYHTLSTWVCIVWYVYGVGVTCCICGLVVVKQVHRKADVIPWDLFLGLSLKYLYRCRIPYSSDFPQEETPTWEKWSKLIHIFQNWTTGWSHHHYSDHIFFVYDFRATARSLCRSGMAGQRQEGCEWSWQKVNDVEVQKMFKPARRQTIFCK